MPMISMVISQAIILPPSSLKSLISLSSEATFALSIFFLTIHLPSPSIFILESGPFSSSPFFNRISPQKVKYIEASMPTARAPFPIISALYTLSISPLCRTMTVFSPISIPLPALSPDLYLPLFSFVFIFNFHYLEPHCLAGHRNLSLRCRMRTLHNYNVPWRCSLECFSEFHQRNRAGLPGSAGGIQKSIQENIARGHYNCEGYASG